MIVTTSPHYVKRLNLSSAVPVSHSTMSKPRTIDVLVERRSELAHMLAQVEVEIKKEKELDAQLRAEKAKAEGASNTKASKVAEERTARNPNSKSTKAIKPRSGNSRFMKAKVQVTDGKSLHQTDAGSAWRKNSLSHPCQITRKEWSS